MSYATYELRKALWLAANPGASSIEIMTAMQRIARECGV